MSSLQMDDVLAPYVYVFYAAFAVSFVLTPMMGRVATYYGVLDQPDGTRKLHPRAVAYLGGIALFLGWLVGLAVSQFTGIHRLELGLPQHVVLNIGVIAGAIIVVLLGLWDDVVHVGPSMKVRTQIVAAAFLLSQGVGTHCAESLLDPFGTMLRRTQAMQWLGSVTGWPSDGAPVFPEWCAIALSYAIVLLLVIGCCNAANLLDGLDGLCGGVTAIISAGFLFVALHLAGTDNAFNANLDGMRIVLALALLGAVLGFVPYNFSPASIFMGDTGSMFLGYCCAVMIILNGHELPPKWFLASMVIFALPVLDTSLAIVRRYVHGRPLFSPDRQHFHHQLCARGFSVRKTVVISYALALGCAILGCLMVYMRTRFAVAIYLIVFSFVLVIAYKMGMVQEKPAEAEPVNEKLPPFRLELRPAGKTRVLVEGKG